MHGFATAVTLSALLAFPVSAVAQSGQITGSVVDETGAVLPGASVTASGPGGLRVTQSDDTGAFVLANVPAGTYTLTVALSGFATAEVPALEVGNDSVEVPAITLGLGSFGDTVVVTASRREVRVIDAPVTTAVITSDALETTAAQNYGDVLRSVPGLNVVQMSARDVNVTSRQSTSTVANTQLVLLDGRSVYLDFFGLVLWDLLPTMGSVEQIEVVRGPASATWGANAMTGAINIITKPPRESVGSTLTLTSGWTDRSRGSTADRRGGSLFGANATVTRAPTDRLAYRISAGYFASDAYARPTGQIPVIVDPRAGGQTVGGGFYPLDGAGPFGAAFANRGTRQPKFDVRVDQELTDGLVTYAAGVAGTEGIVHTGTGPFDIQRGSTLGYGQLTYSRGNLRAQVFTNFLDGVAPNLLLPDPATGRALELGFNTQTFDAEIEHSTTLGQRHVLNYGANVRRNNFDITIAPNAENRLEAGAYVQDEIFLDPVRLVLGGRVDKFGNLDRPVFSPRMALIYKPAVNHSVTVSFNRAFRGPSLINDFLHMQLVSPQDLSGLAPLLPPPFRPAVARPFPLVVQAVGGNVPFGQPRSKLREESLTAYEVSYTGTVARGTTTGVAFYINTRKNAINFVPVAPSMDPYTAANPPPGWPLPPFLLGALGQQGIFLPRTAFTYANLGPLRHRGMELWLDQRLSRTASAWVNYSWQSEPKILDAPVPYPTSELNLPPVHRFNAGISWDGRRLLGNTSVSTATNAFWSDVLTSQFHGFSDGYAMVNGSFGMKWQNGAVTTLLKSTNIFNQRVQQHLFGDFIGRTVMVEVRFGV